jgi:hypothetical protein
MIDSWVARSLKFMQAADKTIDGRSPLCIQIRLNTLAASNFSTEASGFDETCSPKWPERDMMAQLLGRHQLVH